MHVGKVEHFYCGGSASGCISRGNQCDCFLKKLEINCPYAQLCHCWAYTQRIVYPSTETPAQQCSLESVAIQGTVSRRESTTITLVNGYSIILAFNDILLMSVSLSLHQKNFHLRQMVMNTETYNCSKQSEQESLQFPGLGGTINITLPLCNAQGSLRKKGWWIVRGRGGGGPCVSRAFCTQQDSCTKEFTVVVTSGTETVQAQAKQNPSVVKERWA